MERIHHGLFFGKIVEIEENSTSRRVKISIPNVANPTGLATPLGSSAYIPVLDDTVAVQFLMGDINRPVYQSINVSEDKYILDGSNKKGGLESKNFKILIDETETQEKTSILVKNSDIVIEVNLNGVINVKGKLLQLDGDIVNIDGTVVRIAGRPVVPNGKPIE